ncbi:MULTISPECIES: BofC C-terminal domain-containing protein [Gracilibacillus]|uniref:BofC C-terminal domain-containing protein n=1 Tax=Gracilibacillus TaxID=74385 RepID=UPI000824E176|nr:MULTISPECIES: BofC C-terminal domain-containing protein [Gracilibacillus]
MRKIGLAVIGLIGVTVFAFLLTTNHSDSNQINAKAVGDLLILEIELERQFMDGRVETERKQKSIASMEDFWAEYETWQVMEQSEGYIRFRKEIDDISPYLKANGYFGLKNGQLTIFEGIPLHEAAVQSFYQIDTEELETKLYQQLEEGIKINSKADYLDTLEIFRVYSDANALKG